MRALNSPRRLAATAAISAVMFGAGLPAWAADAPPAAPGAQPAAPAATTADPLADLAADVGAILGVGSDPTLQVTEVTAGVAATRTLAIGDEYKDGWKISAIATDSVSLTKAKETRTIKLTGRKQLAVAAPPPPGAPIRIGPAPARPPGAPPPPPPLQPMPTAAMSAALKAGASAQEIAILMQGATPGNINLASATLVQTPDGMVALSATCDTGPYCRMTVRIPDSASYPGIEDLPDASQTTQSQEPPMVQTATAAASQVLYAGGTAQDATRAYLASVTAAGGGQNETGVAPDVSSARFFQLPNGGGVGLGTLSADGSTLNGIAIPNSQNFPGLSTLPTRDEAFPGNHASFGSVAAPPPPPGSAPILIINGARATAVGG